jgi:reverse gyrase
MVRCPHCGADNDDAPEHRTLACWKCLGELPKKKPYSTPKMTQLDSEAIFNPEAKTRRYALKWEKLEVFARTMPQPTMNELAQFVIRLMGER